MRIAPSLALASTLIGCSDAPDAVAPDERAWESLFDVAWSLEPGDEGYWCATHTVDEDLYIQAVRAVAPPGTHHTLLTATLDGSSVPGPDLGYRCEAGSLAPALLHGSGVGSGDFAFPEGVAAFVPAGSQLLVNLHLFNAGSGPLSGVSGLMIERAAPEAVNELGGALLAGTQNIDIPPMSEASAEGVCTFAADANVVAVLPHMHQLGRRLEVIHEAGAASTVIHAGDFSFTDQIHDALSPTLVRAGESIRVRCFYDNPTAERVREGPSSSDEMCLAGLFHYPALDMGLACGS